MVFIIICQKVYLLQTKMTPSFSTYGLSSSYQFDKKMYLEGDVTLFQTNTQTCTIVSIFYMIELVLLLYKRLHCILVLLLRMYMTPVYTYKNEEQNLYRKENTVQ